MNALKIMISASVLMVSGCGKDRACTQLAKAVCDCDNFKGLCSSYEEAAKKASFNGNQQRACKAELNEFECYASLPGYEEDSGDYWDDW